MAEWKEHQFIAYQHEIRAILDQRQSQFRRVITPPNNLTAWEFYPNKDGNTGIWCNDANFVLSCKSGGLAKSQQDRLVRCPYGRPGDLLWVRETWADNIRGCPNGLTYRADHLNPKGDGPAVIKWKPSIFMPRWASRITLRVCDVRVERVQDISDGDAIKEGIRILPAYKRNPAGEARDSFSKLWDDINAKRGYGWNVNPWVWVVSFEVVR